MRVLATLPDQFANIVDILKNRPTEEQTLNSISTVLIEHETARALRDATGSNSNLAGTSGQAMTVNAKGGKYRGKHTKGKGKGGRNPAIENRKPLTQYAVLHEERIQGSRLPHQGSSRWAEKGKRRKAWKLPIISELKPYCKL